MTTTTNTASNIAAELVLLKTARPWENITLVVNTRHGWHTNRPFVEVLFDDRLVVDLGGGRRAEIPREDILLLEHNYRRPVPSVGQREMVGI